MYKFNIIAEHFIYNIFYVNIKINFHKLKSSLANFDSLLLA